MELDKLGSQQVVILPDAKLMLDEPLRCRTLDIYGELQAEARPSELAVLHPEAMFRGTLYAPRLIVHEGAGIKAFLHIAHREQAEASATAVTPSLPSPPPVAGGASRERAEG